MVSILNRSVATACAALLTLVLILPATGQENATPNGIADDRADAYAFTNANIYQSDGSFISGGTLLIRDGRILEINENTSVPGGFFEIDSSGRYIYPGLIDIYTDYGISELEREDNNGAAENLLPSDQAFNINDAIRSNFRASTVFTHDEEERG